MPVAETGKACRAHGPRPVAVGYGGGRKPDIVVDDIEKSRKGIAQQPEYRNITPPRGGNPGRTVDDATYKGQGVLQAGEFLLPGKAQGQPHDPAISPQRRCPYAMAGHQKKIRPGRMLSLRHAPPLMVRLVPLQTSGKNFSTNQGGARVKMFSVPGRLKTGSIAVFH